MTKCQLVCVCVKREGGIFEVGGAHMYQSKSMNGIRLWFPPLLGSLYYNVILSLPLPSLLQLQEKEQ